MVNPGCPFCMGGIEKPSPIFGYDIGFPTIKSQKDRTVKCQKSYSNSGHVHYSTSFGVCSTKKTMVDPFVNMNHLKTSRPPGDLSGQKGGTDVDL